MKKPAPPKRKGERGKSVQTDRRYNTSTSIARAAEQEAAYSTTTKIRSIGNSKGVILNNRVFESSGIPTDADIVVKTIEGMIIISEAANKDDITDLGSWESRFKAALKAGKKPEKDLWEGIKNDFDENEWT